MSSRIASPDAHFLQKLSDGQIAVAIDGPALPTPSRAGFALVARAIPPPCIEPCPWMHSLPKCQYIVQTNE